jgi:hypothetical protein
MSKFVGVRATLRADVFVARGATERREGDGVAS